MSAPGRLGWPILLAFTASGAAGLAYEVAWAKALAGVLGASATAQALVLAAFLGAMAIGYAAGGRAADRVAAPLRWYAALELGVAAAGAASLPLLDALMPLVDRASAAGPGAALAAQAGLAAMVVGPAAAAMGATLPFLARFAGADRAAAAAAAARCYAANAAGGVLGALAAGFAGMPVVGIDGTVAAAAATNVFAAAVALGLVRAAPAGEPSPGEPAPAEDARPGAALAIAAAAACAGAVALALEVAWTRLLVLVFGASAYAFATMLAAFLAGVALGALAAVRLGDRGAPAWWLAAAGLAAAATIGLVPPIADLLPWASHVLGGLAPRTAAGFPAHVVLELALAVAAMLPGAFALGTALPMAGRAAARVGAGVAWPVGLTYAANTVGAMAGAVAAPALIGALGLRGLFDLAALGAAAVAALAAAAAPGPAGPRLGTALAAWAVVVGMHAVVPPWDVAHLAAGHFRDRQPTRELPGAWRAARRLDRVVFHEDDPQTTVTVALGHGNLHLRVNGKTDASVGRDLPTQMLIGHLPLALAARAEDALLVGLGSGVTAGAMLAHPLRRLDVVELSPAVVRAAEVFAPYHHDALQDPRLALHVADAAAFLRRGDRRWDVIVNEPSNPWVAGVGNVFSAEFYAAARRRLAPGGVMVQWIQAYETDEATLALMLRTFAAAFPHTSLWCVNSRDLAVLGSEAPLAPDWARVQDRLAAPRLREDLRRLPALGVPGLLAMQAADDATVRSIAGSGPLNALRRPYLEHQAPIAFYVGRPADVHLRRDLRLARRPGLPAPLLGRYLADRGRPLAPAEWRDVYLLLDTLYPDADAAPVLARVAEGWAAAAPADLDARLARAYARYEVGAFEAAWADLGPIEARFGPDPRAERLRGRLQALVGARARLRREPPRLRAPSSRE